MKQKHAKKHFYDTIIEIESVYVALEELPISKIEKAELSDLVETQVHHTILDLILSQLSPEDKKRFMHLHGSKKHDEVWELLNSRVEGVEDKITHAVEELKKKLHKDIKSAII